ncbi:hypothetical protein WCE34_07420 [Luteimonas sp. MJ204]|uniref:hypothetical protein n=1 Tax=Luteimonas sp. MJ145 TaxID=3129234 RepID=UPI0031BBA803
MPTSSLLALAALLVITGGAGATAPQCTDVEAPPAPVCVSTPYGLAYADTGAEADVAAGALRDTGQRFALHFGSAPVGALILTTTLDPLVARDFAKSHGLDYAQVWLPAKAKRTMTERAMRQAGLDRARINRALAQLADRDAVTLRHEVGHAMYAALYWPDAEGSLEQRYGTPAPDWLDEAAAILMETPESQARHLASFIDAARERRDSIPGLADFLQAEHPVRSAALARALARGPRSQSGVQMMVASGAGFPGVDTFYGQSLLVGLFLAETSGEPTILAPVSAAIADGETFEQWLAQHGPRYRLPDTVAGLQPLWDAWLQQVTTRGAAGKS